MPRGAPTKFYAVRIGRKPGVYTSWPEASKQVQGFQNAVHKSFASRDLALAFVRGEQPATTTTPPNDAIEFYTDGSYIKNYLTRRGIGVFMRYRDNEYRLSRWMGNLPRDASNPTLEMHAALAALACIPDSFTAPITIVADYIYVVNYINGPLQPLPGDDSFRVAARKLVARVKQLRARGVAVTARHVVGHSGDPDNDEADQLAKQGAGGEVFSNLHEAFE